MIEYTPISTNNNNNNSNNDELFFENRDVNVQNEGKLSLTQLWEVIIRTKRLPDGFDPNILYDGVRDKLRDPEREVRQHALRVLVDLIPVTQPPSLDHHMRTLIPEVVSNLRQSAPALRKTALDSLRKYLQHSNNYDKLLLDLVATAEESVISAAPFLINSETSDGTLQNVIDQLWEDMGESRNESTAKSLARMRYTLGDERFKSLLGVQRYAQLQSVCDSYGIPIDYCDDDGMDGSVERMVWSDGNVGGLEEVTEDKVILETEITLKTGPAITMKIHEESRPSSGMDSMESREDDSTKAGVFRVLEDSDQDFYEAARRTPRKVHFGGESIKMRTPESDSNNSSQEDGHRRPTSNILRITVTDAISIRTKKSLIPVRVTSLPSTPRKVVTDPKKKRLHKSAPNLTASDGIKSKIPLKKRSRNDRIDTTKTKSENTNRLIPSNMNTSRRNSRTSESFSPIPVHNEIELLHNLMRSPERKRNPPSTTARNDQIEENVDEYGSFEVFSKSSPTNALPPPARILALPAPPATVLANENDSGVQKENEKKSQVPMRDKTDASEFSLIITPYKSSTKDTNFGGKSIETPSEARVQEPVDFRATELRSISSTIHPYRRNEHKSLANGRFISGHKNYQSMDPGDVGSRSFTSSKNKLRYNDYDQQDEKYDSFQLCNSNDFPLQTKSLPLNAQGGSTHQDVIKSSDVNMQISSFSTEENLWNNSEALDNLIKLMKQPNMLDALEAGPASLLLEALFACQQLDKLNFLADDALATLVKGIRVDVLEKCLERLAVGICKIGAPSGVNLALMVMKKCEAKKLQMKIMEKCFAHRMREGALQTLMAASRLLPSSEVSADKIVEFAAAAALRDRRRRVRHAALETLASVAQLTSATEVLDIVTEVTGAFPEQQHLLRVVRTRLSRRQLPTVEIDGSIRYSTPREQTELDWLAGTNTQGITSSSPSSSASSSNHSLSNNNNTNYWSRNSKHEDGFAVGLPKIEDNEAAASNGNQQIWAVDPSLFAKTKRGNDNERVSPAILRPIYILQPEAAKATTAAATEGGVGSRNRKYDRGRSFSPQKRQFHEAATQNTSTSSTEQHQQRPPAHRNDSHWIPSGDGRRFNQNNMGFRKSFSSEQLYVPSKAHQQEQYSFSLSSRSSTTSTESTRSGIWNRDMRSGIPIPISSETKLRLRTNANVTNSNANVGPVIARRSVLGSPVTNPIVTRLSPRREQQPILIGAMPNGGHQTPSPHLPLPPPRSSGSESSGYFTPPPDHVHVNQAAFVKLDAEEVDHQQQQQLQLQLQQHHHHCSDEVDVVDAVDKESDSNNNNSRDCCVVEDSFSIAESESNSIRNDDRLQQVHRYQSSAEISDASEEVEDIKESHVEVISIKSATLEREDSRLLRFSPAIFREPSFVESLPNNSRDTRNKSKSVVDLQNFLPEIGNIRKSNTSSAPPLKEDLTYHNITPITVVNIDEMPISPAKPSIQEIESIPIDTNNDEVVNDSTCKSNTLGRRLTRRSSRNNSRKSTRSTPRSIRDSTPKSTRSQQVKPKELLQQALTQMTNAEWEVMILGLQALAKIVQQHPEVVDSQIHTVCVGLAKHIKNLRSQVARSACYTASELFQNCHGLDMELEEVAVPLLHRTADTNKFLRADANSALDVMCQHLPYNRVITVITSRGCSHQNSIVRSASMRLLNDIVDKLGPDAIFQQLQRDVRDRVMLAGANALTDGSLEARSYAKQMFAKLIGHQNFQRVLLEVVPQSTLRHIAKTLNSIKGRCS